MKCITKNPGRQKLLSHCDFGNLQINSTNAKEIGSEEKLLHGRDVERLAEERGWNLHREFTYVHTHTHTHVNICLFISTYKFNDKAFKIS